MAITLDGSNLTTTGVINSGTAQNSTSGTSIDFTGIPSGVKRITVMFNGVSTNGASLVQIQLGYSGGVETSGYLTSYSNIGTTGNGTTGFIIYAAGATNVRHGSIVFTNISSNIWSGSGVFALSDAAASILVAGTKTVTGTLDRVRITTVNGTDTFDAGSINILYE